MKKIILFFVIFSLGILSCFSNFNGSYTQITTGGVFTKNSGIDELRVSEDYYINPFSSTIIKKNITTCSWNSCPCWASGCSYTTGYSVDGKLFNTTHPLYKSFGNVRRNWYEYQDGIDARIVYRENTYTSENGVLKPDQSVKVRRYFIASYKHDTTTPTCGEVNYYNDEALTQSFTYNGWWLNQPKYFTMTCLDSETGCYCAGDDESCIIRNGKVISTAQLLWHNIKPTVSFTNKVKLTDVSCQPGWTFIKVLFDLKSPKLDISLGWEDFNLNLETLRVYATNWWEILNGVDVPGKLEFTRSWSIDQIVWNTSINLNIEDSFLVWSVHGVSGLKDYDFSIKRLTDSSFRTITSETLSSCGKSKVYSHEYNSDGSLETSDTKTHNFSCNELENAWKYKFIFIAHDWAWNETKVTTIVKLYPDNISLARSNLIPSWDSDVYANNIDTYDYDLILKDQYGNPIFNRVITEPIQSIVNYNGGKELLLQNLQNTKSALRYIYPVNKKTDIDGVYNFSVKSLQPWEYTQRFTFDIDLWDNSYIQNSTTENIFITNNTENIFLKPFSANISIVGWDTPELGTDQVYEIDMNHDGGISSIVGGRLHISKPSLNFSTNHSFDSLNVSDNKFSTTDLFCKFNGTFNANDTSSILDAAQLDIDDMDVSYTLWGELVRYSLDSFGLTGCDTSTLWLKTIGTTQWDGKWELTGSNENFSDVSTSIYRSQIRKSAYSLIKGMSSWDIINGVKYIEWDIIIWRDQNYETLVVHNGNIFISEDLNPSQKILGLIVLKDEWFNINSDYNQIGNIYIWKDVENIYANLYTDGTLRSANSWWIEYSDSDLDKKLYLKGWIFTRNTIWGAVSAGSDYILPGWSTTTNDILAKLYDLNYMRRAQICWEVDDYSFLIEYDPRVQSTPPKWFTVN